MYLTLAAWATLDLSEPGEDSLTCGRALSHSNQFTFRQRPRTMAAGKGSYPSKLSSLLAE